jgi:hypothetical protein
MNCKRALAVLAFCAAAFAARADDLQLAAATLLYESGQAAPSIELRSIAEDGAVWRAGINGWALSLARERPLERGRRLILDVTATPYDAHSSRRIYRHGERAEELEFDDAALVVRGGLRIRQGEHATFEPMLVAGYERIGEEAPPSLRDAWQLPYAGIAVTERLRFVTADDPFLGRIDGVDLSATGEAYRGNRTWTRITLAESAGLPLGRLHLRQSFAAFGGSGLDEVSAFLVGGSWDLLGPLAVYGTRYAELRVDRGVTLNAGADYALTPSLEVGVRGGAFHGQSLRATGAMVVLTARTRGLRIVAGAGRSDGRTTVMVTAGGGMFR